MDRTLETEKINQRETGLRRKCFLTSSVTLCHIKWPCPFTLHHYFTLNMNNTSTEVNRWLSRHTTCKMRRKVLWLLCGLNVRSVAGWIHLRVPPESASDRPHCRLQFPRPVSRTWTRVLWTNGTNATIINDCWNNPPPQMLAAIVWQERGPPADD